MRRDHADELRSQSQRVPHRHARTDPGSESNGHVNALEIRNGSKEFLPISGDPLDQERMEGGNALPTAGLRQLVGVRVCRREVRAVLHDRGPERAHGGVFFRAVPVRHHDGRRHPVLARGERQTLAMIASRGGDEMDSRRIPGAAQVVEENETAPDFEGAYRLMVFMFHPNLGAEPLVEQGPTDLRRGR